MKKVIVFGVILGGILFTSCKKDYTCNCTVINTALDNKYTTKDEYKSIKKKAAERACEEKELSYVRSGHQADCETL